MIIEEIVTEKKGKRIVHTDAGLVFPLYAAELSSYHLEEGSEITEQRWEQIRSEVLDKRAIRRAMYILQKMERTESQLRKKLAENDYPSEVIDAALEYVKRYHYVDDYRYASVYVRYHQEENSRFQLRMKLMQRGVPAELIERALDEEYAADESVMIRGLLEKKHFHSGMDEKERMRIFRYVLRRGFPAAAISREMSADHWTDVL